MDMNFRKVYLHVNGGKTIILFMDNNGEMVDEDKAEVIEITVWQNSKIVYSSTQRS